MFKGLLRGICEKHSFTHRSGCILGVECHHCLTQKNLQEEIQSRNYTVFQPGINCGAVSTLLLLDKCPVNRATTNRAMALTTLHTGPSKGASWTWSCAGSDKVGKNSSLNHSATSCRAGKQLPKLYQQPECSLEQTPCNWLLAGTKSP